MRDRTLHSRAKSVLLASRCGGILLFMSSECIKLISLNIERDLHYDTTLPFLKREAADVVCLQEVLDRDVERFKKELYMDGAYVSVAKADKGRHTEALAREGRETGTALFSRLPLSDIRADYFYGTPDVVPRVSDLLPQGRHDHGRGVFLSARVKTENAFYTIGTTHFTWTPDGSASEGQRKDIQILLALLAQFPDIVFCGDFNAPRGGEIWTKLAERYTDNIPVGYTTSIDQDLHLVKGIMHVVDGLFCTPEYRCTETRLHCGISDHCAVASFIERVG